MAEPLILMLPAAIGIAVSPLPIAAVILMLMGDRARSNGLLFLFGWMVGLAVLSIIVFAIDIPVESVETATDIDYVKMAIGVLLLGLALHKWYKHTHSTKKAAAPKWMSAVEHAHGYIAFGLGVGLVCLNPKDIALAFDGVIDIVRADIIFNQQLMLTGLFIIIASSSILLPVAYYLLAGNSASNRLTVWKKWLIQHNDSIMIAILLLFGAKLILEAF